MKLLIKVDQFSQEMMSWNSKLAIEIMPMKNTARHSDNERY